MKGYISLAQARAAQAGALETAASAIAERVRDGQSRGLLEGPGPIFVGIGASYAACAAAVWSARERNVDALRLIAGEHPLPFPKTSHPLIGISQSGKSTETLAALNSVDPRLRYSVVNVSRSPIAEASQLSILLGDIPDSYASTIGYTATVAAAAMIAEAWNGGVIDTSWQELGGHFRTLEAQLADLLPMLIGHFEGATYADCIGAAPSAGSAEVSSLLLREIARIPATGMSTRQYLHGAMESAGGGVHVIFGEERECQLAAMLAEAGHQVILGTSGNLAPRNNLTRIALPALAASQRAVLEAVVMQTLAVEVALARGLDPDAFVFHHTDTKVA